MSLSKCSRWWLRLSKPPSNNKTTPKPQTSKIEVKSIEKVYGAYKKKEFKWVSKWKLPSETSLVFESNKYGIKKYNTNEFLIPIEYDAIYSCDFFGHNYHGYILKKETKYGLYITGFKVKGNGFFIPNIFDNIPLVDQFDYVKKPLPCTLLAWSICCGH